MSSERIGLDKVIWQFNNNMTYKNDGAMFDAEYQNARAFICDLFDVADILYTHDGRPRITMERLAELVNADETGRAVMLPCKVGDVVYDRRGIAHRIISVECWENGTYSLRCIGEDAERCSFMIGKHSFGRTVFLTPAESEAKTKGEAEQYAGCAQVDLGDADEFSKFRKACSEFMAELRCELCLDLILMKIEKVLSRLQRGRRGDGK